MWQKLKPKKPNISTKQMTKPSVAIVVETHSELYIIAMEVDKQMVVIQVLVEDVLIDGEASLNIITKKSQNKVRFTQTKTNSIPPQNGKSKYYQTFKNHKNFEDSHTWYSIYSHIYYFEK